MDNTEQKQTQPNKKGGTKIADRFAIAMFSPKEYDTILKEPTGKLIGFLFLLIFLISLIHYAVPALGKIAGMGGVKNIILREVPDFVLENGTLTLDDRYEKKDEVNGIYLVADTDVERFVREDVPEGVVEAIMISRTNMLVYNAYTAMTGQVQENNFSDLGKLYLDNQGLTEFAGVVYFCLAMAFFILYFFEFGKYLFVGLFYSVIFLLYCNILSMQSPFAKIYKTSMYAQAIGAVVYAVTCCINHSALVFAGSIFEVIISFSIMRKVLLPIRKRSELL